jgi:hypothetical protein
MRVVLSDQLAPKLKLLVKSLETSSPGPKSAAPEISQVCVVATLIAFATEQELDDAQ